MAHPLLVPAFLAYPSRRPGRLYTSDVRQRLPGHRVPLAWLPQPSARRVPRRMPPLLSPMPAPTQATASPTDSPRPAYCSPSSVAAAWYSPGYVPREHPLRWSARPLCTPAPAQALASLGVSVYDPTCPCAGACLRCPWRQPTRVPWPLHSRPGAKPAVRPGFAPPTFVGRSVGQNNPPAVCPARRPLHASAHAE